MMNFLKKYIGQIVLLIMAVIAAVLGARTFAARQGKRAAELDAANAVDRELAASSGRNLEDLKPQEQRAVQNHRAEIKRLKDMTVVREDKTLDDLIADAREGRL